MNFRLGMLIKPLVFGFITTIILMFFELRYLFGAADFGQISPGPVYLLVSQVIIFTVAFLVAPVTFKYIKKGFPKGNHLENIGVTLQVISVLLVVIALIYSPSLIFINFLISLTLVCFGLISYRRTKNELAVGFILWGIAAFILSYLLASVHYWS